MKKSISIIITIILFAGIMTGCENAPSILGGGSDEKEKKESLTVYLPMEDVRSLNPADSKDEDTYNISGLIYQSLFEFDGKLTTNPVLVEKYEYQDDTTVVIDLKPGITFSDGDPVTAQDVRFSIEAYKRNSGNHLYTEKTDAISRVNVNGDYQVTIVFNSSSKAGLENLVFPILPSHLYNGTSSLLAEDDEFIPVGSGSYRVQDYDPIYGLELVGNEAFTGGDIPGNKLIFTILPSKNDALNMLNVNSISFTISKESDRDTIYRDPQVTVTPVVSNEVEWLGFNFNNELLKDSDMRELIAYSLDNEMIIETAYYNSGVLSDTIYFPGFLGVGKSEDPYEYNEDEAKKLLKKMGYEDNNGDRLAEDDSGNTITLQLLINYDNASRLAAASIIKSSLERIGIACEIKSLGHDAYISAVNSGAYDIYIGGATIYENYDLSSILMTGNNSVRYSNERLDTHLTDFMGANSIEERKTIFKKIHSILKSEIPYYCLTYKTYGAVSSPALDGKINSLFNDIYRGAETWKCYYEVDEEDDES